MARGAKKEKALTPEEKLAQALVPEAEQPYRVPENWRWVQLDRLYTINPPVEGDDEKDASFVPMEKISAGMSSDFTYDIQPWKQAKKGHTRFADGDVAFAKISPCFENGKAFIASNLVNGIGGGTTELIILRHPIVSQKYTYYMVMSDRFVNGGVQTYSGTVGQQRISMDYVRNYPVPLPPLPEQQRIVDRIESLFAKLDEAKEKAQAVVDGFEDRKAAILHKAFTGELTAKWRELNGYSMAQWESALLKDCSYLIGDGLHGTPVFDKYGQYYFVNGNNFSDTRIEIKPDTKTVALGEYEKYKLALFPDSTVFVSINGTLGKTAFYNGEPVILGKSACYVNVNERLNKFFLRYFFTSKEFIDYANSMATGSTIKNLGLKAMRNLILNLPSVSEQVEIVQILDRIMDAEQQAKSAAEQAISQIDTMKKAILARAFRGELGTNDPAEESAEGLLKSVLQ